MEQLRQRNDDPLVAQQTRRLATAVLGSNSAYSDAMTSAVDSNSTLSGRKAGSTPSPPPPPPPPLPPVPKA